MYAKTQVVHPPHMSLLSLIIPKYICYPKKRNDGWVKGRGKRKGKRNKEEEK